MATPAQALRKGIELLEEHGWIQGEMHNIGGYCSLGAIHDGALKTLSEESSITDVGLDDFRRDLAALREAADGYVRQVIRENYDYGSIVFWNDAVRRTREEVLGVFHEALRRAEHG